MTKASKKSSIQAINDILKAVVIAEHGAGTSPARLAVKLRPIDWNNLCDVARSAVAQASEEITSLRAERDALREENKRLKAGGWQPIETAPKDGTAIDVWAVRETTGKAMRYIGCAWGQRNFGSEPYGDPVWLGLQDRYSVITPTHWMPLPKGPQS